MLSASGMSMGRAPDNDVIIADESVSRLHAILEARSGGWSIRDLGSRNGTFVNGERILGERALRDRDEIRVGGARLAFRPDPEAERYAETLAADPPPELTRRERDVLLALFQPAGTADVFMEPASTRRIAEVLFVSEAAVKQHLLKLYEKFGIRAGGDRRRVQLANEALRRGAVSFSEVRDIMR
ncbi:FHA domain-containing protein [Sporichthya brevicatena]|uniref:FHA domain-containing protein n=1 Tax=Sporichthya brevicatena TaxID=171442 RepID=UPI0031D24032